MALNDSKRFHFLMHEIDARINNETSKTSQKARGGIEHERN